MREEPFRENDVEGRESSATDAGGIGHETVQRDTYL